MQKRFLVLACLCATTAVAHAELELKNDGFVTNGTAGFQSGFDPTEAGASRFVAPAPGRQLLKVQLLFGGGSTATRTITLKVYDDTAGTDAPGAELFSADYTLTGSDSAMQEINVAGDNITLPAQFRVAIVMQHMGAPSIARDADGSITGDKNFLLSTQLGWVKSQVFALTGDWIIRAFISDDGMAAGDGAPDAGVGAACASNTTCPIGQFCDPVTHACSLECRVDDDCGGGTCNSLGQCVGGGEGGGCCQSNRGSAGLPVILAVTTLALLGGWRRRRWPSH
jgi:hypothetical protein